MKTDSWTRAAYNGLSVALGDAIMQDESRDMNHDLTGRVALVTGASRGLGAVIARKLAASGASLAVNYFGSRDKAEHVVQQIREAGGIAEPFRADVREEKEVAAMVAEVEKAFGPIDVLVI